MSGGGSNGIATGAPMGSNPYMAPNAPSGPGQTGQGMFANPLFNSAPNPQAQPTQFASPLFQSAPQQNAPMIAQPSAAPPTPMTMGGLNPDAIAQAKAHGIGGK